MLISFILSEWKTHRLPDDARAAELRRRKQRKDGKQSPYQGNLCVFSTETCLTRKTLTPSRTVEIWSNIFLFKRREHCAGRIEAERFVLL
jgi:hypothetical protein